MRTSEQTNEIAAALSKAQGEIQDPEKNAENAAFSRGQKKAMYADLAEVLRQIRPVFSRHGLALVQFPSGGEAGVVTVTTRVIHASGQWMEDSLTIPVTGTNIAHATGSVTTYARRYMAAAIAAISQVDDDGNQSVPEAKPLTLPALKINSGEAAELRRMISETESDETAFLQHFRLSSIEDMPASALSVAFKALERKAKMREPQ